MVKQEMKLFEKWFKTHVQVMVDEQTKFCMKAAWLARAVLVNSHKQSDKRA